MKRLLSLLVAFIIMTALCACQGNFGSVNLNAPVAIPEDGKIPESLIGQIKNENAIGIFTGESNGLHYEWTIFGSDVSAPKEINLGVQLQKQSDGSIGVTLGQGESFGFSALLSVYLDTRWDTLGATAYAQEAACASVSVTGSKTTILNITLDGTVAHFVIRPDAPVEEETQATEPAQSQSTTPAGGTDSYLSNSGADSQRPQNGEKDKYLTDPVPAGKPQPVEPEDTQVNKQKSYTCTFSIECSTILNNLDMLDPDKLEMLPSGGVILAKTTVTFYEGESVFDVLQRLCKEQGIHMEASWTPIYNSAYVEGIHNLYEFDCGALSGWMYQVNGWYPNYGCSRYQLKDGDVVQWRYTCDLGNDVGGAYAVGG